MTHARQRDEHRRGIRGEIALGFPEDLARPLGKGDDTRAIGAADTGNQALAYDERRGSVTVLGRAGNLTILPKKSRAEVIGKIDAPKTPALSHSQALKLALAGLRIDAISVNYRRATGTRGTLLVLKCVSDGRAPKFLGIVSLKSVHSFFAGLIIEIENLSSRDDRGSESLSNF